VDRRHGVPVVRRRADGVRGARAPQAGDVVGAIFPRYYGIGVGLGVAAFAAALFLRARSQRPTPWAVALLASWSRSRERWSGAVVHPQARRLRAALENPAAGHGGARRVRSRARHGRRAERRRDARALTSLGAAAAALRH
jgi:hypothetical protein